MVPHPVYKHARTHTHTHTHTHIHTPQNSLRGMSLPVPHRHTQQARPNLKRFLQISDLERHTNKRVPPPPAPTSQLPFTPFPPSPTCPIPPLPVPAAPPAHLSLLSALSARCCPQAGTAAGDKTCIFSPSGPTTVVSSFSVPVSRGRGEGESGGAGPGFGFRGYFKAHGFAVSGQD